MRSATFSMKLRQPGKRLRIYILACDFSMLYAFERECLPLYKMGWQTSDGGIASARRLQKMKMDALRERPRGLLQASGCARPVLLDVVERAGAQNGLRKCAPNVHSKLMVIDDDLMLVGSANLSNRPMMLDTECTIAIDANGDPHIWRALLLMNDTLLAEHPGWEPEAVGREISERHSMNEAIAVLLKDPAHITRSSV
jgi:hypothetical protein